MSPVLEACSDSGQSWCRTELCRMASCSHPCTPCHSCHHTWSGVKIICIFRLLLFYMADHKNDTNDQWNSIRRIHLWFNFPPCISRYLLMGILVTSMGQLCISLAIRISEVTTWPKNASIVVLFLTDPWPSLPFMNASLSCRGEGLTVKYNSSLTSIICHLLVSAIIYTPSS